MYEAIKRIRKDKMEIACVERARSLFDKEKNQLKYIDIYPVQTIFNDGCKERAWNRCVRKRKNVRVRY